MLNFKKCSHCVASDKEEIEHNLVSINNCTNCLVDIQMKGKWTGDGYAILNNMIKKHGIETIKSHWFKLKLENI